MRSGHPVALRCEIADEARGKRLSLIVIMCRGGGVHYDKQQRSSVLLLYMHPHVRIFRIFRHFSANRFSRTAVVLWVQKLLLEIEGHGVWA